ncbi:putative mitochondrial protein, partial [Phytophthora megakarya]
RSDPYLALFVVERKNRRSHAGARWKQILQLFLIAMREGWCDLDLFLDPYFLHFPKRTDEVAWYPGIEARSANLADPQLHHRESAGLIEALAEYVTECTLLELHNRLGHLAFDTLGRMADAPGSGIKLTSRVRQNYLTCAQGKQHKGNQSKEDTGQNAPVDKNKVEATKKFEHFLVFFENEYNCRMHVLRTDGGGEYMKIEDFSRATGVRRQVREDNNQASNVEYAAYVLNRSACSANPKRMSLIEVLTGKFPDMAGIVTFGSPTTSKGFKVYIPKDMIVEREEAAKQKEQTPKKKKAHIAHGVDEGAEGDQGTWVQVQVVQAVVTPDPKNYREPMRDARADKWREAIKVEFEALESNNACEEYGVDYIVSFSAVLDMTTDKLIFVMAHVWGRHSDVPGAYVKADKEKELEIYLYIPDGIEISDELLALLGVKHKGQLALRLIKSLYGLKQAGRLWYRHLHKVLMKLGFSQCYTDSCLYYKHDEGGVTLVGVYVNDLLVTTRATPGWTRSLGTWRCWSLRIWGSSRSSWASGSSPKKTKGGCSSSVK